MCGSEWTAMQDGYGPLVKPLPPTLRPLPEDIHMEEDHWISLMDGYGPPIEMLPRSHVPRSLHELSDGTVLSRTKFQWEDAVYAISMAYNENYVDNPISSVELPFLELRTSDEGTTFSQHEREDFDAFLRQNKATFEEHGPLTPYAEHRIDTGTKRPVAGPPYRMSPKK